MSHFFQGANTLTLALASGGEACTFSALLSGKRAYVPSVGDSPIIGSICLPAYTSLWIQVQEGILTLRQKEIYHLESGDIWMLGPSNTLRFISTQSFARCKVLCFQPTGFFRLSGHNIETLTDRCFPLQDLLGQIPRCEAGGNELCLEQLLRRFMQKKPAGVVEEWLERCVGTLQQCAIQQSVACICDDLHVHRRRLERRFRMVLGMSPKQFLQTYRFYKALELLQENELLDMQDIVYQCGYFDQSHLIREFKQFLGQTPLQYLKTPKERTYSQPLC